MVGFPSTILEIAKYGLAKGYEFPPDTVKAVFPTAETITSEMRDKIQLFFKTKLYDQYASSEGAPFIFECVNNRLHLELQSGVFEVLDENNQPSQSGRLVVTSFTNEGTPLIRYDIGDSITLEDDTITCSCGNNNPLGKKVVFLPNSFGPFEGLTVKNQVSSVFKELDLVYAREHVSAKSLGHLLNKKIPVEMDLGFFLEKGNQDEALRVLKKYNFKNEDKIVGITIRPWRFPGFSNPEELYAKYIDSVVFLTKHLIKKGYKVALCNQSIGPNSHEDDRNAIRDLLKKIQHPNIIWIDENLTCDVLKAIYSNFYFFVGTRFHSIIFSLTSTVPSIAIGYGGNKAKGIMGDFNLNNCVVQIQDVNPDLLVEMFDNAILNYETIKNELKNSMELVLNSRNRLVKEIQDLYH